MDLSASLNLAVFGSPKQIIRVKPLSSMRNLLIEP